MLGVCLGVRRSIELEFAAEFSEIAVQCEASPGTNQKLGTKASDIMAELECNKSPVKENQILSRDTAVRGA
jgi:hypothetical protein